MAAFELRESPARPAGSPAGLIAPNESWSPLERWVWDKLQAGAIANIDEYEDEHGRLPPADPKKPEDWQDGRRRLAPRFLEDLLLREPYRSGLHRQGVRIEGARFDEAIDLSMAELARAFWLAHCRFEKAVGFQYLRTPAPVFLDSSAFAAPLDLQGACIDADLLLRSGANFNDVVLRGAKIGGQVSLRGAKVAGTLNADSADIGQSLVLRCDGEASEQRAEFNEVNLRSVKVGGQVSLTGAKVAGTLNMDSADIGQSLLMRSLARQRAEFNDVILNNAKVGGQLSLLGAKVGGTLALDSARIGQSLLMRSDSSAPEQQADFNEVVLRNAKIGGQVSLTNAKVAGTLNMDSAEIGQNLFMRSDREVSEHSAEFNRVILRGTKIGGQVDLTGASVAGTLSMDSADIGDSLFIHSDPRVSQLLAVFHGGVRLIFAEIERSLDVRGAVLSSLDLTGARVGELTLASRLWSPQWPDGGRLILRNASVDAIQDTDEKDVWPPDLDLDGFTYRRLGGLDADAEAGVAKRGSRWLIDWLAKDKPYTPQPYQQCAQVLREMGHPEMANAVLYAGRERERKQAWHTGDNPRGTGLTLLKWFIGYGYGQRLLWHPLAWVVALVAAGTAVLHLPPGLPSELAGSEAAVVAYSFDTLLPIVELEKSFADIVLHGFAKYYFYFQKLMGWVLASFLIAGLSGLTK